MIARTAWIVLGAWLLLAGTPRAQMPIPTAAKPPDGHTLFLRQCGTCHTIEDTRPFRQGPPLGGVVGRKAGSVTGFPYSAGFAKADWGWDPQHLDQWLTNPQAMIPGAVMGYRQADPAVRRQVIAYLQGTH